MTSKPTTTERFTATHDGGETWVLEVNAKRGIEFANTLAARFARNYALKHGLFGSVNLVSHDDGREVYFVGIASQMDSMKSEAM